MIFIPCQVVDASICSRYRLDPARRHGLAAEAEPLPIFMFAIAPEPLVVFALPAPVAGDSAELVFCALAHPAAKIAARAIGAARWMTLLNFCRLSI